MNHMEVKKEAQKEEGRKWRWSRISLTHFLGLLYYADIIQAVQSLN